MTALQDRLRVRVRSITYLGDFINGYEVVDPEGRDLPPFTAGAHVDLHFRDGRIRQYSLCSPPNERHRYMFAVQREDQGRGGSKAIFEKVHVGRILTISLPRNNFPLVPSARHHLFLAGGIGITPIVAMILHLEATGGAYTLHYSTRSRGRTAFIDELAPLAAAGKVHIHHDGGDPTRGARLEDILRVRPEGTCLYYCGPSGYMAAVKAASSHWPREAVHCEHFTAPPGSAASMLHDAADSDISVGFQIKLASSGAVFDIPNDKSIVSVLRENGINVATSCESGVCGTCRTRYLAGVPEHRDLILSDEEKLKHVLICCARSRTPMLVLDL